MLEEFLISLMYSFLIGCAFCFFAYLSRSTEVQDTTQYYNNSEMIAEWWREMSGRRYIAGCDPYEEGGNGQIYWLNHETDFEFRVRADWMNFRFTYRVIDSMRDDVKKLSPEEKIEVWLPLWVGYLCEWHLKERTGLDKEIFWIDGPLDFDDFIAQELFNKKVNYKIQG